MLSSIVLGLGFGDEGKGLTTAYLCSKYKDGGLNPIVVRFNGGHQAGHTVAFSKYGERHVFSSLGSGTLQGVPTYWSKFCTFYPTAFLNEIQVLRSKGVEIPEFYINPLSPITTPFDIFSNKKEEDGRGENRHGSVGVGFGKTVERQEKFYKLHAQDLFYPSVLEAKLESISYYYRDTEIKERVILDFIEDCKEVANIIKIAGDKVLESFDPIFEGAQGILLDQDYGFFPNVTRSNTTSKNALEILRGLSGVALGDIYLVTRSYLTRHGNGYMPEGKLDVKSMLRNNGMETNVSHDYQGNFRIQELNTELLNYAIQCESIHSGNISKNLVVTCTDQFEIDIHMLMDKINHRFTEIYISEGDTIKDIKKII